MYLPLIAIFVAISGSMGVSYMTENAHPGDVLYPIKVQINELKNVASGASASLPPVDSTSSDSVYLRVSSSSEDSADTAATTSNSDSLDPDLGINASTSIDMNGVINTK